MADRVTLTLLAIMGVSAGVLGGMALIGAHGLDPEQVQTAPPIACERTRVIDGDTFDCGATRIRLLAIDAPEMDGGCRDVFNCPSMSGEESKAQLAFLLGAGGSTCSPVGSDSYGRTLATCSAAGRDLSCGLITAGAASYVEKWDNGLTVARLCPEAVR